MIQPYYVLDFSASACFFEVRVNDYPVIQMNIEGQVSTMTPINFAILETGIQSISARVFPNIGNTQLHPKSKLKFDIKLFDVTNDFIFNKQFGDYQSESVEEKKIPIINYVNTFQADVPYKLKAWQNGRDLKDVKNIREKLELAYQNIIKLLEQGNYEEYKKIISLREFNMATSMYLSKVESEDRIAGLINEFKTGFKIMPISKDAVLQYYGFGKAIALKKLNGEPALYLENKETQEELMLDISFYIPEGKEEFEVI